MPDINLKFLDPTWGRTAGVTLDDAMTVTEAIAHLLDSQFVPALPNGYVLQIRGGAQLGPEETFAAGGVKTESVIRILPRYHSS